MGLPQFAQFGNENMQNDVRMHSLGKACGFSTFKKVLNQRISRAPIDILVGGIRIEDFVEDELVSLNELCHIQSHSTKKSKRHKKK